MICPKCNKPALMLFASGTCASCQIFTAPAIPRKIKSVPRSKYAHLTMCRECGKHPRMMRKPNCLRCTEETARVKGVESKAAAAHREALKEARSKMIRIVDDEIIQCRKCHGDIKPHPGEYRSNYKLRTYCSVDCYRSAMSKLTIEQVAAKLRLQAGATRPPRFADGKPVRGV